MNLLENVVRIKICYLLPQCDVITRKRLQKTEDTGDLNSDNDIYKYRPRAGHSSQERTLNSSHLCANSSLDRLDVRCGRYQFLICRMDHN